MPGQVAREEALHLELKPPLEQAERQFKEGRDDLFRTLLGIEFGLSDIRLGEDSGLGGLSSMPGVKTERWQPEVMETDSLIGVLLHVTTEKTQTKLVQAHTKQGRRRAWNA
jgi:hypothetical protein